MNDRGEMKTFPHRERERKRETMERKNINRVVRVRHPACSKTARSDGSWSMTSLDRPNGCDFLPLLRRGKKILFGFALINNFTEIH